MEARMMLTETLNPAKYLRATKTKLSVSHGALKVTMWRLALVIKASGFLRRIQVNNLSMLAWVYFQATSKMSNTSSGTPIEINFSQPAMMTQ